MKKLRDFTQGDKLNALKTALVVVLLLGIAGSGFLGTPFTIPGKKTLCWRTR